MEVGVSLLEEFQFENKVQCGGLKLYNGKSERLRAKVVPCGKLKARG